MAEEVIKTEERQSQPQSPVQPKAGGSNKALMFALGCVGVTVVFMLLCGLLFFGLGLLGMSAGSSLAPSDVSTEVYDDMLDIYDATIEYESETRAELEDKYPEFPDCSDGMVHVSPDDFDLEDELGAYIAGGFPTHPEHTGEGSGYTLCVDRIGLINVGTLYDEYVY